MDVQEEAVMGSKHIFKGKRTKRQRTMSSLVLAMATSSCSSGAEGGDAGGVYVDLSHFSSALESFNPSHSDTADELAQSSVEEEDMANCLILLAQGSSQKPSTSSSQQPQFINRSAVDVYQCKTCDRCFPSFQALGGHRASHSKPKVTPEEKKPALLIGNHEGTVRLINQDDMSTTLSLQIPGRELSISTNNNNKSRVHECSICGAEFSSGQALGGHMRRHRPLPTATSSGSNEDSRELKKQRTLLSLDLNLPAAAEPVADCRELNYPFTPKQEAMVFSASPLVDCHY